MHGFAAYTTLFHILNEDCWFWSSDSSKHCEYEREKEELDLICIAGSSELSDEIELYVDEIELVCNHIGQSLNTT